MKRPVILNAQGRPARTAGFGTYGTGGTGPALTHGGYRNPLSGAGGHTDKSDSGFFQPTYLQSRQQLETIYVESWACRKFIDILIDDMTIRWRSSRTTAQACPGHAYPGPTTSASLRPSRS